MCLIRDAGSRETEVMVSGLSQNEIEHSQLLDQLNLYIKFQMNQDNGGTAFNFHFKYLSLYLRT